jgi:hypothetical protein
MVETKSNLDLAYELKRLASDWVARTFNHVPLATLEKLTSNQLYEYIEPEPLADFREEWWDNIDEDARTAILDDYTNRGNQIVVRGEPLKDADFVEWLDVDREHDMREWRNKSGHEEYPMWSTLFEFKDGTSDEIKKAAQAAGFGIIEGGNGDLEDYGTILFVSGCGYSFYGAHWIPLWLALPWNDKERERFAGVDFQMM